MWNRRSVAGCWAVALFCLVDCLSAQFLQDNSDKPPPNPFGETDPPLVASGQVPVQSINLQPQQITPVFNPPIPPPLPTPPPIGGAPVVSSVQTQTDNHLHMGGGGGGFNGLPDDFQPQVQQPTPPPLPTPPEIRQPGLAVTPFSNPRPRDTPIKQNLLPSSGVGQQQPFNGWPRLTNGQQRPVSSQLHQTAHLGTGVMRDSAAPLGLSSVPLGQPSVSNVAAIPRPDMVGGIVMGKETVLQQQLGKTERESFMELPRHMQNSNNNPVIIDPNAQPVRNRPLVQRHQGSLASNPQGVQNLNNPPYNSALLLPRHTGGS